MRKSVYIIVATVAISFVSCNLGGWKDEHKKAYMEACTGKAEASFGKEKAEEYCACTMEKMMEKFPDPADAGKVTTEEATEIAAKCLK